MNLKLSRILVLIFAIFCPIYILVVFFTFDFKLEWLPFDWGYNSQIVSISANWISPILFCISWLYFLFLTGKRLASTIQLMGETSSVISAHYIIFYGVCAIVMLVSFLIPLLTPIVGVLAFSSLVFTLLTSKVNWDDLDDKTKKFVKFFTFFVNIPMIFCSILVVPELIGFSVDFFLNFWNGGGLEYLYFIMKGLGVALPIGNFMLLYRNAVGESEGRRSSSVKSNTDILFVEIVITGFLFLLEFYNIEFVQILYYGGMVFWILSFIANFVNSRNAGKSSSNKLLQSPLSLIMFAVFWVATTIFGNDRFAFSDILRKIIVGGAAFVFIFVFFLVFIGHPDLDD
ncbi:hypothetical protein NEF87_003367 [Candidatus Lokiarchaeum ossiferum]|uniref:Uncharacterized protein n=1 Tax=Candidatus Lokiarchaeum ossiferum TaxID=2951803 RepID=A0ABY6HW45_9ARCH|nr:hypothetical protein NEF87_003367 [Candidatus Lokiarchaeum sp. B-35]